jgi:hypothetical protein
MLPNESSFLEPHVTTPQQQTAITTSLEGNRIIAHALNHKPLVDEAVALGLACRIAQQAWEAFKPKLRHVAKACLDIVTATSVSPSALYLHGSSEDYIEIVPSKIRKALEPTLLDEAKFVCINELVDETEVTLTGPLAKWALENLPKMANPNILKDNFKVKTRWLVVDNFKERVKSLRKTVVDPKILSVLDRLADAGYNSAAVEVKTSKKGL